MPAMVDAVILDLAAIAETREVMKAKFPAMVQYFLEDAEGYVQALRDAASAADVPNVVSSAHALKSSAHQMGAMRVSALARTIEMFGRAHVDAQGEGAPDLADLLAQMEAALAETKDAFGHLAA
jgi:HPt (histidine-containing phosphotransfer) domain-containing protein